MNEAFSYACNKRVSTILWNSAWDSGKLTATDSFNSGPTTRFGMGLYVKLVNASTGSHHTHVNGDIPRSLFTVDETLQLDTPNIVETQLPQHGNTVS